jgi:ATP-binding cassette, subfamily B, bacterial HlyB/CyaB
VGEVSSRINELEKIRRFLTGTALTVVLDAVFALIYIAVMLLYSVSLTFWSLAVVPFFVGLTAATAPIIRAQLRDQAEANARVQSHLVETLGGMETVKGQGMELHSRWRWQQLYGGQIQAGFRNTLTSTAAGSASKFFEQLSGLLVLWVGAGLVLKGEMTLGQLIAFRILAGFVTSPLLRLATLWQNFQETALSLERLADIIDQPEEIEIAGEQLPPLPPLQGGISYEGVNFRFGNQGPLQLVNVGFEIPAGAFIGIVGSSGSGKSTLLKLLTRLYDPLEGRIRLDGYDISKVDLYSLRAQIGVVPQDSLLFDGSVLANLSLTRPDASFEEICLAAEVACAHEFIQAMPAGYSSSVGERGAGLSGGQRQRIAIARMVLKQPRLLILDEATSALDGLTEKQVTRNLMEAYRGRTVLFITHRLGALRHADQILVMDQGALVEQGAHAELMALGGRYATLYSQQEAALV